MATASANSTEVVLGQHVQALISRNLDSIVQDYTDDAVVFSPNGAFKGHENIRAFFTAAWEMLPPDVLNNLKVIKQEIDGEYAYVLWSAEPILPFAGDTFRIHDGKIVMQSAVFQTGA
jgi:ketosteroid isomerase-like protein